MPYPRSRTFALLLLAAAACKPVAPPPKPQSPYVDLGPKDVPEFMKGTIWEQTDLSNSSPARVSGFGLVVNLDGTGDTRAPNPVRDYMIKQMEKHGFGSSMQTGYEKYDPEKILNDAGHQTAIVRIDGFIPPGAHKNDAFDVQVTALDGSNTSSLHRGQLYESDLAPRGADPFNPGGGLVNPWGHVSGPIAVNPSYALADQITGENQKLSMRYGIVMGRGLAMIDRPLVLKLRQPQRRIARQIEARIDEHFQQSSVASAKDEGQVWINVPLSYGSDWEHFSKVVMHLYFNASAETSAIKSQQMADVAVRDREKAPLDDITYCWEGLGEPALPAIRPLFTSDSPDVAYAAARAAACIGDITAQDVLAHMAETKDHPFQINAVETLGDLHPTTHVRTILRGLLDTDQTLVRVAAYKAMLKTADPVIVSRSVREQYILDMVESNGPPIVYASRVGVPRIALIGRPMSLKFPTLVLAMKDTFTLMTDPAHGSTKVFYRGSDVPKDVTLEFKPDLGLLIARLGGESPPGEPHLTFGYSDVVGLLQKLIDDKLITASTDNGQQLATVFELQQLPGLDDPIDSAPTIQEQRPTK